MGGITLSSSNASGNGPVRILSGGSLQLSTSQGNQPIYLQAGTGGINLSSGTTTISGNVNLNSGTLALNGVAYTFPGSDGSASNVLTTSGAGLLSWGTLGAASITADSLDFSEFKDELTLDADTTINGDYSLVLRTGLGSIQNSTSGSNDLQLSAEDKLILSSASFDLSTSNGAVDIISNQRLDLSAGGTLTLDTSANNTNIVLTPGTGNVGIGTTAPDTRLHVKQSSGNTFITVDSVAAAQSGINFYKDGAYKWIQYVDASSNDLRFYDGGNRVVFQSGGNVGIGSDTTPDYLLDVQGTFNSDGATYLATTTGNVGISSTSPAGILDIGSSAAGILLRAGQPGITISSSSAGHTADIQIAAPDRIDMFASSFNLTTSNTSDGSLKLTSYGNLTLDTSQGNKKYSPPGRDRKHQSLFRYDHHLRQRQPKFRDFSPQRSGLHIPGERWFCQQCFDHQRDGVVELGDAGGFVNHCRFSGFLRIQR